MKLTAAHIEDLTLPRYIERIITLPNMKQYKAIVDTHTHGEAVISPKFAMGSDLTKNVDELNKDYHNTVAEILGFDLNLGINLTRINRSSW